MTLYEIGYYQGVKDKVEDLPINLPCALTHTEQFKGYFHGYGGHEFQDTQEIQEFAEKYIATHTFIE
tara:strand:+ start:352 stop:552 length:201 start_codon:yes stop_codon:yes gene_type:complete